MGFRVREAAENMLTPTTVGPFTLMKTSIRKKSRIRYIKVACKFLIEGTIHDQTSKTTKHVTSLIFH